MLICESSSEAENINLAPQLASLLKAAGDELRLQILKVLSRDSFGVLELCSVFGIKQSALSHHLKVLASAGLVTTRREGNSIFYRRAHTLDPQTLLPLQQNILQASDLITINDQIEQGISQVQQERAESSQKFFNDNANKFKAQQDLIAGLEQYGPSVIELIQTLDKRDYALEVGPGEGAFLETLSGLFDQVDAIEISTEMLAKSQASIDKAALDNVKIKLGDTTTAAKTFTNVDCIIANMVLHHTPNPGQILKDLSQCLIEGGSVILCDLLSHDQSWARENCGDVWLGFDEDELSKWASQAGLNNAQETFLTLRNGFRIQIRQFTKPLTNT